MDLEQARFYMVEQQIRTWEVLDSKILDSMMAIPREVFVPKDFQPMAFMDIEIPLPNGYKMMFPKVEARTLQALDVQPEDRVLEIGTGTGLLTAHLASLCAQVTSVEIDPELVAMAQKNLASLSIDNVTLVQGDGAKGWNDGQKYDVIVMTGAMYEVPQAFFDQLTLNGRLFCITGEGLAMQATLWTRLTEGHFQQESLFETQLDYLKGAEKPLAFAL